MKTYTQPQIKDILTGGDAVKIGFTEKDLRDLTEETGLKSFTNVVHPKTTKQVDFLAALQVGTFCIRAIEYKENSQKIKKSTIIHHPYPTAASGILYDFVKMQLLADPQYIFKKGDDDFIDGVYKNTFLGLMPVLSSCYEMSRNEYDYCSVYTINEVTYNLIYVFNALPLAMPIFPA